MDPLANDEPISGRTLQHIPYNQRWDYLKDIIVDAFLGRNPTRPALQFKQLSEFMETNHAFSARPEDYRYRLRKWNIRKNTKEGDKEAIVKALGKRNRSEGSVNSVQVQQGDSMTPVDSKQLKRYLRDSIRHHTISPLTPGIFSRWNLPYTAYRASLPRQANHHSPFGHGPMTPENISITSPEANFQGFGMTPTFAMVQQKAMLDRSNLLLQGRREDLLSRCNAGDRRIISNWLYDYWMHCFITAKFWGLGPQEWTAHLVSQVILSPALMGPPQSFDSRFVSFPVSLRQNDPSNEVIGPIDTCFWVIHYSATPDYERVESPPVDDQMQAPFELHDQSSWTPWPNSETENRSYQKSIECAFIHNRFSMIAFEDVMVSHKSIADAILKSPQDSALDSWAFAIMTGNRNLIGQLEDQKRSSRIDLDFGAIDPYHLAASFLDGGKTCCHMICDLTQIMESWHPIALNNLDSNGHTILDSLMISILRSHTNLTPAEVSTSFVQCFRFPGEEKDICGRWDADSPEVQRLLKAGRHRIPENWKHNFCHSSVQAVCHSVIAVFMTPSRPDINTFSGLFRRRCRGVDCRLESEMRLGPLHALVAVAFYLAENGKDGENMFGAVALLVCMLVLGTDTTLLADISVRDLFSSVEQDQCSHRSITAMELADQVPQDVIDGWKPSCRLGWRCLSLILRRATRLPHNRHFSTKFSNLDTPDREEEEEAEQDERLDPSNRCAFDEDHDFMKIPCSGESLGVLWAAIQTELVTYRRVGRGNPGISPKFDFVALLRWLEEETPNFETSLVNDGWMKEHSSCGWFGRSDNNQCPAPGATAAEVSSKYFMNMDIWTRATFVEEMMPLGHDRYSYRPS